MGEVQLFTSPSESLCSSDSVPATQYPKATQCCCEPQLYRQVWDCRVHTRWAWVSTHYHYHHQKTRNKWLGATWNLPQTPSRPQHLKS